jgi:hypothetical protein
MVVPLCERWPINVHKEFTYSCEQRGVRVLCPAWHEVAHKVERQVTSFIFGWRPSARRQRENLLHAYTRHVGRKSRYKQQHIARRIHHISVAACSSLRDATKTTCLKTEDNCVFVSSLMEHDFHKGTPCSCTNFLLFSSTVSFPITVSVEERFLCQPNHHPTQKIRDYIQSVPGGNVNILTGHSICHSKQKL